MRFGIVEPRDYTPSGNPGWHMINAGIRNLFRKAWPGSEFISLPMLRPWDARETSMAKTCDVLVLAGNPRYDSGEHKWLYAGVMDQMLSTGAWLVDAWQGAGMALGNSIEDDARRMLANPRNQASIERLRHFGAIITRDDRAQRVNELAGLASVQLPCSSWWAAEEYGITCMGGEGRVFIAQRSSRLPPMVQRHRGWRVVATNNADMDYCREHRIDAELIYQPMDILSLFAWADEVVSYRLHAGIPAASLGCKTALSAIDTRAQAGEAFGIPWAPAGQRIHTAMAVPPIDPTEIIKGLL